MHFLKKIYFGLVVIFCTFCFLNSKAQSGKEDSLKKLINSTTNDSIKVKLLYDLSQSTKDKVLKLSRIKNAYNYAIKTKCKWGIASIENRLGYYYMFINTDYPLATYWTTKSLKNNIAIKYLQGEAQSYQQLGIISSIFNDNRSALNYFRKAAFINEKLNLEKSLRTNYSMAGLAYFNLNKFDSTLLLYRKAERISLINNLSPAVLYVNMSDCFIKMNQFDSAKKYIHLTDSSYMAKKAVSGKRWVDLLNGKLELKKGNFNEALTLLEKTYTYARKDLDVELISQTLPSLTETYKKLGKFEKGFISLEELNRFNDSINGAKNASKIMSIQRKFEEEQMVEIQSLIQQKIELDHQIQINSRNKIIWGTALLLVIVSLFGFLVFRSYKQKQKAHTEITHQKKVIEEKQKEIIDSITYAKRIQTALITSEKYIEKSLNKLQNK